MELERSRGFEPRVQAWKALWRRRAPLAKAPGPESNRHCPRSATAALPQSYQGLSAVACTGRYATVADANGMDASKPKAANSLQATCDRRPVSSGPHGQTRTAPRLPGRTLREPLGGECRIPASGGGMAQAVLSGCPGLHAGARGWTLPANRRSASRILTIASHVTKLNYRTSDGSPPLQRREGAEPAIR